QPLLDRDELTQHVRLEGHEDLPGLGERRAAGRRRLVVVVRPAEDLLVLALVDAAGAAHVRELPDHREPVRGDLRAIRGRELAAAGERGTAVHPGAGGLLPGAVIRLVTAVDGYP